MTFQKSAQCPSEIASAIEFIQASDFPGRLAGRRFDCIVAMDLLDRTNSYELLTLGGDGLLREQPVESSPQIVPGNFRSDRQTRSAEPYQPCQSLRGSFRGSLYPRLCSLQRFRFCPLARPLILLLRNLSILLENAPVVRTMAGSIFHAQKPPRKKEPRGISLFAHKCLWGAVSVVIPCHNEEMNVGPLIERILGSLWGIRPRGYSDGRQQYRPHT